MWSRSQIIIQLVREPWVPPEAWDYPIVSMWLCTHFEIRTSHAELIGGLGHELLIFRSCRHDRQDGTFHVRYRHYGRHGICRMAMGVINAQMPRKCVVLIFLSGHCSW